MIKGHVKCAECPDVPPTTIEANNLDELGALLGMSVVTWHVKNPHSAHKIMAWIGELDQPEPIPTVTGLEEHELDIKCIFESCPRKDSKRLTTSVPIALVSGVVIIFHASHEGHALEVNYNGKCWKSPV